MSDRKESATDRPDFSTVSRGKYKYESLGEEEESIHGDEDELEGLTAEFKAKIGLAGGDISDSSVSHLGLADLNTFAQTGEALPESAEVVIEWDDTTLHQFQFDDFVRNNFGGHGGSFTRDRLTTSLLKHDSAVDSRAAVAIWTVLQRYMGDIDEKNDKPAKSYVPIIKLVIRELQRSLYAETYGGTKPPNKSRVRGEESENFESKKRRKSSIRKFLDKLGSEKSSGKTPRSNLKLDYTTENLPSLQDLPNHPNDMVQFIIAHGIVRRHLRDEIYCQVIKQLTNNPRKESEEAGWRIFCHLSGSFKPSPKLEKYVNNFIVQSCTNARSKYLGYIKKMMDRTLKNGTRYHAPNILEIRSVDLGKYYSLPIILPDDEILHIEADAQSSAQEICRAVSKQLGIRDTFGFALYFAILNEVSCLGSGTDHVMDAVSECELMLRDKGFDEDAAQWTVFFRKELFSPWHEPAYDNIATDVIYAQVKHGLRAREYKPESEENMAELVAQIYFITNGKIKAANLKKDLSIFLSSRYLVDKSADSWISLICKAGEKLGLAEDRTQVKQVVEDLTLYAADQWYLQFSALFSAFQFSGPPLPNKEVVIGVNHIGVYLMVEPYKSCSSHPYFDIVQASTSRTGKKYGHTFNLSTVTDGLQYSFVTAQAQNIADIVQQFLDGLQRRSRYVVALVDNNNTGTAQERLLYKQGDLLRLLEANPDMQNHAIRGTDNLYATNERTGQQGQVPLSDTYILPCIEKPPSSFLAKFKTMDKAMAQTLPRQKGRIMLGNETIGRHKKFGLMTAA